MIGLWNGEASQSNSYILNVEEIVVNDSLK